MRKSKNKSIKGIILVLYGMITMQSFGQNLQCYYNPNHSLDPVHNSKNFVSLYFEYFKTQDSGKAFIKPGSFLLKMQADFIGAHDNMGKFFLQISQTIRFWKPKLFINLQYGGGLGVTEPKQYSYYIINTYSLGLSYPFKWGNAFLNSVLNYRYVPNDQPSSDPLFTLYWWLGLIHYKLEIAGDFSIWTENKNRGDDLTRNEKGKRFYFFAEPQFWYNLTKQLSVGTKINLYYHVLTPENILQVYPTIGIKWRM